MLDHQLAFFLPKAEDTVKQIAAAILHLEQGAEQDWHLIAAQGTRKDYIGRPT